MQHYRGRNIRRRAIQVARLMVLIGISSVSIADEIEPQILVHHSVEIPSHFDTSTLRAIFSGRMQRWPNGMHIKVFVLPQDNELHQTFCRKMLRTFPYTLQRQWDQQTFTGSGVAPTEISTSYQLREKVSRTPGAIGYGRRNIASDNWIKFIGGPPPTGPEASKLR